MGEVKKLFEYENTNSNKISRSLNMIKNIDEKYYGYRSSDTSIILNEEAKINKSNHDIHNRAKLNLCPKSKNDQKCNRLSYENRILEIRKSGEKRRIWLELFVKENIQRFKEIS